MGIGGCGPGSIGVGSGSGIGGAGSGWGIGSGIGTGPGSGIGRTGGGVGSSFMGRLYPLYDEEHLTILKNAPPAAFGRRCVNDFTRRRGDASLRRELR